LDSGSTNVRQTLPSRNPADRASDAVFRHHGGRQRDFAHRFGESIDPIRRAGLTRPAGGGWGRIAFTLGIEAAFDLEQRNSNLAIVLHGR